MTTRSLLAICFGFGLVLRALAAGFQGISHDAAAFYLPNARALFTGGLGNWDGMSIAVPPLFPTLTALLARVVPGNTNYSLEVSALVISVVAGAAVIFPARGIVRHLIPGDERVERLAILLASMQPLLVSYGGDARADSLYVFLFSCSLWAGLRTLSHPCWTFGCLFGSLVGLAYLLRPEALGLPVLLAVGVIVVLVRRWRQHESMGEYMRPVFAAGIAAILFLLPSLAWNMAFVHHKIDKWTLSPKAGILMDFDKGEGDVFAKLNESRTMTLHEERLTSPDSFQSFSLSKVLLENPTGITRAVLRNLVDFSRYFPDTLSTTYFVLFLAGLFAARGRFRPGSHFILVGILAFYALSLSIFYITRRFWLPYLPLTIVWCALGAVFIAETEWRGRRLGMRWTLLLVLIFTVSQALYTSDVGRRPWWGGAERDLGQRLVAELGEGQTYADVKGKVAWFASGKHLPLAITDVPFEDLIYYLRYREAHYLVLDRGPVETGRARDWLRALWESIDDSDEFTERARETADRQDLRVLELRARGGG